MHQTCFAHLCVSHSTRRLRSARRSHIRIGLTGPHFDAREYVCCSAAAGTATTDCGALALWQVPSFRQQYLDGFTSRGDLLDAVLASAHIPFLLNWAPVAGMRGGWFLDGSLKDFLQCGSVPPLLGVHCLISLQRHHRQRHCCRRSHLHHHHHHHHHQYAGARRCFPSTSRIPAPQAHCPPESLLSCHVACLQVEEFRPAHLWRCRLRGGLQPGAEASVAPITAAVLQVRLCRLRHASFVTEVSAMVRRRLTRKIMPRMRFGRSGPSLGGVKLGP